MSANIEALIEKYATKYCRPSSATMVITLREALTEQAKTHALELRAYEAKLAGRIRQLEAERMPDVDWLSNIIRMVDGNHSLGAGQLAEKIVDAMLSAAPAQEKV